MTIAGVSDLVDEVLTREPRLRHLQSLVVVRHGELVLERYLRDRRAQDLTNCHSITKSFLSALTGIAIREGAIGLTTAVGSCFPGVTGAKSHITVEHLLTMSAGLAADGPHDIDEIADAGGPWVEGVLRAPLRARPGTAFTYSNGAAHVLGALVAASVREPLNEFAEERLFSPLGITDYRWPRDPEGNPLGYGALEVRPRDLVALGRLFLSGGVVDGQRVLDAAYVERATRAATAGGPPEGAAYGYLWWISDFEGMQMFFAAGYGGQYVVIVPAVDVVAVTTTDVNVFIPSSVSPMKLLTQVVLPNVVDGEP